MYSKEVIISGILFKQGGKFVFKENSRPDWTEETKKKLLTDVINSQWAKTTSLSEFLTTFIKNQKNFSIDGVIDSLDRRHIISWSDLKKILSAFFNRNVDKNVLQSVTNLLIYLTSKPSYQTSKPEYITYGPGILKPNEEIQQAEKAILGDNLKQLNDFVAKVYASPRNVFLASSRKNRQIQDRFDDLYDLRDGHFDKGIHSDGIDIRECVLNLKTFYIELQEPLKLSDRVSLREEEKFRQGYLFGLSK